MTVTGLRRPLVACLAAAALATAAATAPGQGTIDLKPYRKEAKQPLVGTDRSKLADLRNGKLKTTGPDEKVNRALLDRAAKTFVYDATNDKYYLGNDTGPLAPRPTDQVFDYSVLRDLETYIVVPTADGKINLDQADYAKEFGVALDRAFRDVLPPNQPPNLPPVMRVNVGRLLALACRSGAPAHADMVTKLLTGQYFKAKDGKPLETPPELLYYAMKAAEGLLAAYDPYSPPIGPSAGRHTLKDPELVELCKALEGLILHNPPVKDKAASLNPDATPAAPPIPIDEKDKKDTPPGTPEPKPQPKADANDLSPEQLDLIRFYRRAAVRALAKVRFDIVGGQGGVPESRPGYTLAKVAVADVALSPPPSHTEVAEAVIGLCGINPSPPLQVDELGWAIAYGVALFVRAKPVEDAAKDTPERRLPTAWKVYAARLGAAAAGLKRNTQVNARLKGAQKQLSQLADYILGDVVAPLEKGEVGVQPNLDQIYRWAEQNAPKDKARSFYTASPQYILTPRPAGG